jgi:hypothetical protein
MTFLRRYASICILLLLGAVVSVLTRELVLDMIYLVLSRVRYTTYSMSNSKLLANVQSILKYWSSVSICICIARFVASILYWVVPWFSHILQFSLIGYLRELLVHVNGPIRLLVQELSWMGKLHTCLSIPVASRISHFDIICLWSYILLWMSLANISWGSRLIVYKSCWKLDSILLFDIVHCHFIHWDNYR